MVSFKALAFALMVSGTNAELRASRRLSFESIAGYSPRSQVTDHAAIDLDQAAIEEQLALATDESYEIAKNIYVEGAHSKSFARVTLATALTADLPKGTTVEGLTGSGTQVVGQTLDDFSSGASEITIQYQTSDIQAKYVGCQVGARPEPNLGGCFASNGTLTINGSEFPYTYNSREDNDNGRTIQGFSTEAKSKMFECANCPYVDYEKFVNYYGEFDYANQWILAALDGTSTQFDNGNANFGAYAFPGRTEAVKKGTAYMAIWMYVIREFEDALDDCKEQCILCNDDPVHAWDEGVAFYTGSLEGQDGAGEGNLIYALADKRCANFKTCGVGGDQAEGTAKVNYDLLGEFALGQQNLLVGNCEAARVEKERIAQLMTVPLVQGTLRYAYITDKQQSGEKEEAEGAVFAASVLPVVHACNAEDAKTIYNNMAVGSGKADFAAVKKAFENNYNCMGISCADIGGLYDTATKDYFDGAAPCTFGASFASNGGSGGDDKNIVGIVLGSIAGFIAVVALFTVFYMRKRERAGKPVFAPQASEGAVST